MEEGGDGVVGQGQPAGGVAGGRGPRRTTAAHRHDRLLLGQAPGQTGELARVAQGLQILQDDLGGRVLLPVLHEVVAGHVGAVARGHERGQSHAPVGDPLQDGAAQRAGLGEEADGAGRGQVRGEGGVEGDRRVGVGDAQAVGAHHAHAGGAGGAHQLVLADATLRADLTEPGADHDESVHALLRALFDHVHDRLGAHRHHGQVDLVGDVQHRRVGAHAHHGPGLGVHRVDGALELTAQEVAQGGLTDGVRGPAGTDDGDRFREEQTGDGTRLGALLAGPHDLLGVVGGLQVQREPDDPFVEGLLGGVPGLTEDVDHPSVLGQHVGDETPHPAFAGGRSDVFEHDRGQATALVTVLDHEGDLGLLRGDLVVTHHGDQGVRDRGDQGHTLLVVDRGEAFHVAVGQLGVGREEPVVDRLRREPGVELAQQVGVVSGDGAQVRGAAVGQNDVGFPVFRVGLHDCETRRQSVEYGESPRRPAEITARSSPVQALSGRCAPGSTYPEAVGRKTPTSPW